MKHSADIGRGRPVKHRKQALLPIVRKAFIEEPVEKLCMQELANRSGVSLWALRYAFENGDTLFREVMRDTVRSVAGRCRYSHPAMNSVIETISGFAQFTAALVSTSEYRDLLYLILRYGRCRPWLEEAYQHHIVKKLHEQLELAVLRTGQRAGHTVLFRKGAVRKFHRTIEMEFGLAPLLHADSERSLDGSDRILREATAEAFGATYLFEWEPASAA